MITRKEAEKIKEGLLERLSVFEWFRGITLGLGGTGISIRVAVEGEITDVIRSHVPPSLDGVEIILESAIESIPFDPRLIR